MNRIMRIPVTMTIKTSIIFLLFPLMVFGQESDFQLWFSRKANVKVFHKFEIHLEQELRLQENSTQMSRQMNDVGISYKISRLLRAGVFYRLEADWKNADEYSWRNGLYSDISARYDLKRFTLGYRLRLQTLKVETINSEEYFFDGFRHRHKLSIKYDIKGIPLEPFIENELFFHYSAAGGTGLNGNRTWIGVDYIIKKRHTITMKYGLDKEMNESNPLNAYIVNIGYAINLSLNNQSKE